MANERPTQIVPPLRTRLSERSVEELMMTVKRMTREDIRNSGVLNPVGHIILAFPDDIVAAEAVTALRAAGFAAEDILVYLGADAAQRLRERISTASQTAGFGYEITLMRRYLSLAQEGCGWLIVYAPGDDAAVRVTEVATRLCAKCAVRYHRLVNEDLI